MSARCLGSLRLPLLGAVALAGLLLPACAGSRTAPPPPMGSLAGPWLLGTEAHPVRFVKASGDTVALLVSREPVVVRTGGALSDTSVAVNIAGVLVSGALSVPRGSLAGTPGELVTAGPSAGRITFTAPGLSFEGTWGEGAFAGTFRVDREQAGKDVVVLDAPQTWTLRRLGSAPQ